MPSKKTNHAWLKQWVTDTEKDVFALTNLPEVLKGALFSRYSRSRLGLRELLLKEFLPQEPSSAAAAPAALAESASHPALNVARAEAFYKRLLDNYGDDSVGELGSAHLALENLSLLAAKSIQDARIGGSPLEKSTRYVSFAQGPRDESPAQGPRDESPAQGPRDESPAALQSSLQGGFHREARLMRSPHRKRYWNSCEALFATYQALQEPLKQYLRKKDKRPANTSQNVYEAALRAEVFDALRGLLPAATRTNMGLHGNGRFFHALLLRMREDPLHEVRALSKPAYEALEQVLPAFLSRANPQHRQAQDMAAYQQKLRDWNTAQARETVAHPQQALEAGRPLGTVEAAELRLLSHEADAPQRVLAALAYPHMDASWERAWSWAGTLSAEAQAERFRALAALRKNRRHKAPRALELAHYDFELLCDFGSWRDLQRHRMLTQQRQRFTTDHGYLLPELVREAGLASRYAEAIEQAAETYLTIAHDYPWEAQYVVPIAFRVRWCIRINLRALIWLVELRTSPQGHPAYRAIAQALYREVQRVHPHFASLFGFADLDPVKSSWSRLHSEQRREKRQTQHLEGVQKHLGIMSSETPQKQTRLPGMENPSQ